MWEWILQTFFPDRCIGCGVYGRVMCPRCAATCPCYVGGVPDVCVPHVAVRFVYTGYVRQLVLRLKYAGAPRIAAQFAQYMPAMYVGQRACYIAVPASPERVIARGYDQAVLLAHALAVRHHGYVAQHLVRVRNTPTQAKLTRHARQQNVQGVFAWQGGVISDPVVLVDDVCTTGATLNAAIDALRMAGITQIAVQVIARGVHTDAQHKPPVASRQRVVS